MEINSTLTPWDFFETYKYSEWKKLSNDVLNKLMLAILIILDDLGRVLPSPGNIKENLDNGKKIHKILQI